MRFAFCIEKNVPRFDVSMEDAVLMRVVHGASHLRDQFHRLPDRHRRLFNYFVKLAAFDKLHAEVALAITLANFVDWNNARMLQACCRFCFAAETFHVRFARPLAKADDL